MQYRTAFFIESGCYVVELAVGDVWETLGTSEVMAEDAAKYRVMTYISAASKLLR